MIAPKAVTVGRSTRNRSMDTTASTSAWLRLALAGGVGTRTKHAVIDQLTVEGALRASVSELEPIVGKTRAAKLHHAIRAARPDVALAAATRVGQQVIVPGEDLDHTWLFDVEADAPLALYVEGTLPSGSTPRVAVVGTRRASAYGLDVAQSLACDLVGHGVCVVSGFALGIDGAAHTGAVQGLEGAQEIPSSPATLAVLGCGIDVPYPRAHGGLRRSVRTHGAFLSEYPPGTAPARWHFPERNRLVASWADAVVVVEAPEKSGALITAHLAMDAGRDVLVVPGSVRGNEYRGSHSLLQSGAAVLCTGVNDVLAALGRELHSHESPSQSPPCPPDVDRFGGLWRSLDDTVAATADVLCTRTDLPAHTLRAVLTQWELQGWVQRIPGLGYLRTHP